MTWRISGRNWSPELLGSSLALWLDAADASTITLNGATVSQWNDKSGNNNHATQAIAVSQPTYSAAGINNKPSLNFDGTADVLPTALVLQHPMTLYAVAKSAVAAGSVRAIIGSGNLSYALGILTAAPAVNAFALWNPNRNGGAYINNAQSTNPVVLGSTTVSNDENTWNTYVNGSNAGQAIWDTGTPNAPNFIRIGYSGNGAEYWSGDISEVVTLNRTATTNERQRIEGYLAWKWGLEANLPADHPYKNTPPIV